MTEPAPSSLFSARNLWIFAGLLIAARVTALIVSPLQLYPDEAQYWKWSRDFAFGYYSKPPMVAWLIGLTTALFGNAEWAVRLGAPLVHAATAGFLFLTGRALFGERAGLWTAIAWLTLPGPALSSFVVATDAPLLLAISASLYAFLKFVRTRSWLWACALGAGIGLGFLSKYAMLFFVAGAALAFLYDAEVRRAFLSPKLIAVPGLAALIFAPNLIWNAQHGFATVAHTADNANLDAELYNAGNLFEFWLDQFAVAGPVLFPMIAVALAAVWRARGGERDRVLKWLALFALPAFLVISLQAFLSRANANWAASAYPAAILMVTGWALVSARRWYFAGLAVNAVISLLFLALTISPALADAMGLSNSFKRMRGWDFMTQELLEVAQAGGYGAIVTDDRFVFQSMDYYARNEAGRPDLRMWLRHETPHNHAAMTAPLTRETAKPVLLVSYFEDFLPWLKADFARLEPMGTLDIPVGGGRVRRLHLYEAQGYEPVPRDQEPLAR